MTGENGAKPARQALYSKALIWSLLKDYRHLATGGRVAPREDRLGARRQRQDDAPWSATAVMKADIEMALQALPFQRMWLVLAVVVEGRAVWRVALFWEMTSGQVSAEVRSAVEGIYVYLNGGGGSYDGAS